MSKMDNIVKKAEEFVTGLLVNRLPSVCIYHNLEHTQQVVEAVIEIGKNSGLSEEQLEIIELSAWFHDTGFVQGFKGHERKSIEIAEKFLKENNYPQEKISLILKIISVTEIIIKPDNLLEMIIRDADIIHMGKEKFYENSFLLKQEWEIAAGKKYSESEWINSNLDFLNRTEFYTSYAKSRYGEQKQKNIAYLKSLLKNLSN